jgi:hypothetical protein
MYIYIQNVDEQVLVDASRAVQEEYNKAAQARKMRQHKSPATKQTDGHESMEGGSPPAPPTL